MTEVQTVEQRLAALEQEHVEFKKVHVSRRGVQGVQGERGETGATGPSADPKAVAEIAANLVQKALRYETQVSKFENLIKEFESEIVALRAALKFAIIEELQLSGFVDSEGRAVPGPAGADSQVPGPKGDSIAGRDGVDGIPGRDGRDATITVGSVTTGSEASVIVREDNGVQVLDFVLPRGERGPAGADSKIPGPRGERGESGIGPEGLPGLPGEGLGKTEVIELVRDLKRRGTI